MKLKGNNFEYFFCIVIGLCISLGLFILADSLVQRILNFLCLLIFIVLAFKKNSV